MPLTLDLALNSGIVDFTDLLRIESGPLLVIEGLVEQLNILQIYKVDECVADVAFVKEINGKVEKIELVFELSVYGCEHLLFCIFIGNIPDH